MSVVAYRKKRKPVKTIVVASKGTVPKRRQYKGKNNNDVGVLKCIGFPRRLYVKMKYSSELITLTCTAGASTYHQVSTNNLYDPDYSAVGHQPLGRDQWAAFYGAYLVHGARIQWEFINNTNVKPFNVVYVANPGTSGSTTIADAREQLRGLRKSKLGFSISAGNDNKMVVISRYIRPWEARGITRTEYVGDRDEYGSTMGSGPNVNITNQVWVQPFDEATTTSILARFNVIYDCELSVPNKLAQS